MKTIVLIGYMGAGKTTLGRALAERTGKQFIDLDQYIEQRFRQRVADIFATQGEERFRQIEHNMLHEVAEFDDVVLACGGGTPCFFDNMAYLNSVASTVYLRATPDVLQAHIGMSHTVRPLLLGKTPDELHTYIVESLQSREPYYLQARHIVDIDVIHTNEQIGTYVEQIIATCSTPDNDPMS